MYAAKQHWNEEHQRRPIGEPDPCCERALAFFGDVRGKSLLDLGCGRGENTIFWAEQGARVTAVDLSPVAIERLQETTAERGLEVNALVYDAFKISELGKFDFVFGQMILHHLEPFDHFADELAKTVGGKAFFFENSAVSRLLIWCRNNIVGKLWIPKKGDPDEFPLTPQEVDLLRKHLRVEVQHHEMMFLRLISVYLLNHHLKPTMRALDEMLFKVPAARRLSYRQDLLISSPSLAD